MKAFMPFFYLRTDTGGFGLYYNLESIYQSFIEMIAIVCLFFILTFLVLHFVVCAVTWVEHIVCGGTSNDIFGGFDNE